MAIYYKEFKQLIENPENYVLSINPRFTLADLPLGEQMIIDNGPTYIVEKEHDHKGRIVVNCYLETDHDDALTYNEFDEKFYAQPIKVVTLNKHKINPLLYKNVFGDKTIAELMEYGRDYTHNNGFVTCQATVYLHGELELRVLYSETLKTEKSDSIIGFLLGWGKPTKSI